MGVEETGNPAALRAPAGLDLAGPFSYDGSVGWARPVSVSNISSVYYNKKLYLSSYLFKIVTYEFINISYSDNKEIPDDR